MRDAGEATSHECYAIIETEFGACGLAWNTGAITRLQLPEASRAQTERRVASGREPCAGPRPAFVGQAAEALAQYFAGKPVSFVDLPVEFGDIPRVNREIYAVVHRIPWGETVSYGEVAHRIGIAGAARLVGRCMARNPVPVIIPCHRVLAQGHGLGGFSAPGGVGTKLRLLALEQAMAIERLPLFTPRH